MVRPATHAYRPAPSARAPGLGARGNAKAVALQGTFFSTNIGRIVAPAPLGCGFAPGLTRESRHAVFDTVCEANFVEVKNAVENTAKEIGTRFDFGATSAASSSGDKEITLFGDANPSCSRSRTFCAATSSPSAASDVRSDVQKPQKIGGEAQTGGQGANGIDSRAGQEDPEAHQGKQAQAAGRHSGRKVRVTGAKRDDHVGGHGDPQGKWPTPPLTSDNFRD